MKERRIRVKVGRGMFSTERSVSFQAGDQNYTLIVDQGDVRDDQTMLVRIIAEGNDEAIIDLPRETFTSGNRIRVPKDLLMPA